MLPKSCHKYHRARILSQTGRTDSDVEGPGRPQSTAGPTLSTGENREERRKRRGQERGNPIPAQHPSLSAAAAEAASTADSLAFRRGHGVLLPRFTLPFDLFILLAVFGAGGGGGALQHLRQLRAPPGPGGPRHRHPPRLPPPRRHRPRPQLLCRPPQRIRRPGRFTSHLRFLHFLIGVR